MDTLEKLLIPDPSDFEERPPIEKGKIVNIEIKEGLSFNNNTTKNLHLYILDKDTKYIHHQIYKISKSTKSKYFKFIQALSKANKKANANIKTFKDLLGVIYKWEYKTETYYIGNEEVKTSFWIPTEYKDKEPITTEEEELLKEYLKPRDDELTEDFLL